MRQEQVDFDEFLANRFGQYYESQIATRFSSGATSAVRPVAMSRSDRSSRSLHDRTPSASAERTRTSPSPPQAVAIGDDWQAGRGAPLTVRSPIDGTTLAEFPAADAATGRRRHRRGRRRVSSMARSCPRRCAASSCAAFGERVPRAQDDLATLVTWEAGKITQEALGEVQEMIDICDFAVGLSRQLYGKTIASERPGHRLTEQWHPLGPVGVITAFNFPVAVWAWNAMIGLVCGDPVVWKPSEKTPLCGDRVPGARSASRSPRSPDVPPAISSVVDRRRATSAKRLRRRRRCRWSPRPARVPMGRAVAQTVAARLGRSLLELGGNNGMIVAPSADLELAVRSIVFAAAGTCGQRCTTLRRLIVHESIADELRDRLLKVYERLPIGDPTQAGVLVGPLIDERAFDAMEAALAAAAQARRQGPRRRARDATACRPAATTSGRRSSRSAPTPPIVQQETFAPILYLMRYRDFDEAIRIHNGVPQGLVVGDPHRRRPRGGAVLLARRLRLRHRQREHRHQRRGDRRRVRRRKGNRRRPRIGQRRLESLHAPRDQHGQLLRRPAAGAGHQVRRVASSLTRSPERHVASDSVSNNHETPVDRQRFAILQSAGRFLAGDNVIQMAHVKAIDFHVTLPSILKTFDAVRSEY